VAFDPSTDYPLGTRRPDLVTTARGTPLCEVTLAALREGRLDPLELRATPETLRRQAAIAEAAGRVELAVNLARAAELAPIPDDVVLEVYTALRPHRSTAEELDAWADRLESRHGAELTAAFVREARDAYAERGFLSSGHVEAL
jgi:propanediol dehydratase small subunit